MMKTVITILMIIVSTESALARSSYIENVCSQNINAASYTEKDVKVLMNNLKSTDENIRGEAAYTLACLGNIAAPAIPLMIRLFKEPNGEARGDAIEAVAYLGKLAVPSLLESIKEKDIDIRRGSCEAIDKIGPPAADAIPELVRLLNEPGHDVSHSAAYALGSIGKAAIPTLLEILKKGPDQNRSLVVQMSFRRVIKDDFPKEALLALSVSPTQSPAVRQAATEVLGHFGVNSEAKIPELVNMLGQTEGGLGLAAARALAEVGRPAVPAIMRSLSSPDAKVRSSATYAVQYLYFPLEEAVPILTSLLDDKEPTVKYGASFALQRIGTKDAIAAVNKFKQRQNK